MSLCHNKPFEAIYNRGQEAGVELMDAKTSVRFPQQDQGIYQGKIQNMISENKARLIVNVNDLRRRNEARAAK